MKPKRIALHLHAYYLNQLNSLKFHINNVLDQEDTLTDLFITLPENYKEDITDIFPQAQVFFLPNKGYDVGPFFYVLNKIDLNQYDYVIKLHTKRDDIANFFHVNNFIVSGPLWKKYLLEFVSTPKRFKKTLESFGKKPEAGLLGNGRLILNERYDEAVKIVESLGLEIKEFTFVAGTMFIVRAHLLKILQNTINFENFETTLSFKETNAHIYERVLGYIITAQGFTINDYELKNYKRTKFLRKIHFFWLGA